MNKAVIIATAAALISSIMAFVSWWYNKELSKATISLVDVKVNGEKVDNDKLKIDFLFIFKNVGKESSKISELSLGHVGFKSNVFEQVGGKPILNPIHPESIFNYSISFTINVDPQIPNETVGNLLPRIVGKHAIILKLRYKGTSFFSRQETLTKYFLGYEGYSAVYQLTEDQYKEIKDKLPKDFRVDE